MLYQLALTWGLMLLHGVIYFASALIEAYLGNKMDGRFEFRKKLRNTHKFKVSPLRNIGVTAAYLHDGRYASLAESLGGGLAAYRVHEAGITDEVEFDDTEFSALPAFLNSLTGEIDFDYIQYPHNRTVAVCRPRNADPLPRAPRYGPPTDYLLS